MTAILVVAGRNFLPPNGDKDHLKTRKGKPVSVWGPDQQPGLRETSPNFVLLNVLDATQADLHPYLENWVTEVDYEILGQDPVTDTFTVRAFNSTTAINPNVFSGRGELTGDQISTWLSGWGIFPTTLEPNNVVFTANIYDVLKTRGFWEYPGYLLSNIIFTELDYSQVTGNHRIQADYTNWQVNTGAVERAITKKGGTIVSHDNKVIVFDITRAQVFQKFKDEVKERTRNYLSKNRFYFTDAVVDNVIANDGIINTDLATLQSYIKDRLVD